jgi:hypothetical protein
MTSTPIGSMAIPTETWVLPRPRKDAYVGSFPLHFEKKLHRLLGEPEKVLHPFGGLAEIGDWVDLNETTAPTWVGDGHDMHWLPDSCYDLVILDPPYDDEMAAELYGTPPLRYGVYTREAVRVCKPGGHVAIYHWVMTPRPEGTRLVQRVIVLTRTWHRPRVCMVYQKMSAEQLLDFEARLG